MDNRSVNAQSSDPAARLRRFLRYGDRPWNILVIAMALLVILLVLAIGALLLRDSAQARSAFGLKFLLPTSDANWNPVMEKFQAWPFIYGTLLTSLVALLFAIPVSIFIAIFLAELSSGWLRTALSWMVELLAAIPSVVYGLWGIFVFLPLIVTPFGNALNSAFDNLPGIGILFQGPMPASGSSRLAAGMILSIMIIPTIAAVTRDVFLAIPEEDNQVDALYNKVYHDLIDIMIANPSLIDRANLLMWAAHNLERLADRVTNICERTVFVVSGKNIEIDVL